MNGTSRIARRISLWAAIACLMAPAALAAGEDYPSRPVRIVVPYGAGGIADVTMRLTARKMSERLGQQFIIDNRPGGGGVAGMKAVATSPPDGYTLSMIGGGLTIAKSLFKFLPYDLEKDFVPISTTAAYGLLVATKRNSPLKSVQDILATAQREPGKLNFGTINPGSAQHLSAELFRTLARIDVTMVPYKTTPELLTGLLRGDIDVAFEYDAGLRPALEDHSILAVAFTGPVRAAHIPDVPTVAEAGFPGTEQTTWTAVLAPARTPAPIIARLNQAIGALLKQPEVMKRWAAFGIDPVSTTPDELSKILAQEIDDFTKAARKANISAQ